jgi:hypothetical protein
MRIGKRMANSAPVRLIAQPDMRRVAFPVSYECQHLWCIIVLLVRVFDLDECALSMGERSIAISKGGTVAGETRGKL